MEEVAIAEQLKNDLDRLRPIDKEMEAIIMQKFRLDWNYHSNHIEGNSLTYGETKSLILFNITAQGKPLKDHIEMSGHNEALNWAIDLVKGERPLTENFIRELHSILLKESYQVDAITLDGNPTTKKVVVGSYKTTENHVKTTTGEIFRFATVQETPAKMTDLLNWFNEKRVDINANPILLAAEFHYRFIRIHPFDDGNGRTARILMNFILMQFGYPPAIIKTEDKANYFVVLQLADAGNIEPFINYIAKNLNYSLNIMIAGAKGENIEELDDVDKEISLIKQKLKGLSSEFKKQRSLENIVDIVKNSLLVLANEIKIKFVQFDDFYLIKEINVFVDGSFFDLNRSESLINHISTHFDKRKDFQIGIKVYCAKMRVPKLENIIFNYSIVFDFELLNFRVQPERENLTTKAYQNLSDKEVAEITKRVINEHNNLINSELEKE